MSTRADLPGKTDIGLFGVNKSNLAAVVKSIRSQKQHHRKMSFEDEYLAVLKKHGIEFDPRFVFG